MPRESSEDSSDGSQKWGSWLPNEELDCPGFSMPDVAGIWLIGRKGTISTTNASLGATRDTNSMMPPCWPGGTSSDNIEPLPHERRLLVSVASPSALSPANSTDSRRDARGIVAERCRPSMVVLSSAKAQGIEEWTPSNTERATCISIWSMSFVISSSARIPSSSSNDSLQVVEQP